MRRPFMDTPDQLASLEGQQYLVLRPTGAVAEVYREIQETALDRLGIPARRPHTGHVTLRGFSEPERREELAALIRTWAAPQEPIEVSAETVDEFPLPWQILIVRLARSASQCDPASRWVTRRRGSTAMITDREPTPPRRRPIRTAAPFSGGEFHFEAEPFCRAGRRTDCGKK